MVRIDLRESTAADAAALLEWRNDPETRAASRNTELVGEDEHVRWLQNTLAGSDRVLFIADLGGEAIGQVRFDRGDENWEISVALAPQVRGKGLGTALILAGCRELRSRRPGAAIVAWIRPENRRSEAAFRAAGFRGEDATDAAGLRRMTLPVLPLLIAQARTGSERLPGKVLADIGGAPLLGWLIERLRGSRLTSGLLIATTTDAADDAIELLGRDLGVCVFRGHPTDVLARFAAAAEPVAPAPIVRVSGDSPLLHNEIIDLVVEDFLRGGADLVENHRHPGWPVGTAVEVMTYATLRKLDRDATDPDAREHVTLAAYRPGSGVRTRHVDPPAGFVAPGLRICVDTSEDLQRVRAIAAEFAPRRDFGVDEVVGR